MALASSGCLISDPPEHDERTQTVPVLDALGAVPSPTQILNVTTGETRAFTVEVRSEDDGEELWAMLHLNYGIEQDTLQTGTQLPPSTFDRERTIRLSWAVPERTGCSQVSMVVAHESNVEPFTGALIAREGAAVLTWWANINASDATLNDCPSSTDIGPEVSP